MLKNPQPMKEFSRAFLLIQTAPKKEREVMERLLKFEEVVEAHMITGTYDVLAVVQVKRMFLEPGDENIINFVIEKVEGTEDVIDTNTIIATASKTKFADSV
jgi:DNA-binding Lrp family transcriptional regulator